MSKKHHCYLSEEEQEQLKLLQKHWGIKYPRESSPPNKENKEAN